MPDSDIQRLVERIEGLTGHELAVFEELGPVDDCGCLNFAHLAERLGLPRDVVQVACRSLRKQGIAECYRGLWTEDGDMYGSGYGLSPNARKALRARITERTDDE